MEERRVLQAADESGAAKLRAQGPLPPGAAVRGAESLAAKTEPAGVALRFHHFYGLTTVSSSSAGSKLNHLWVTSQELRESAEGPDVPVTTRGLNLGKVASGMHFPHLCHTPAASTQNRGKAPVCIVVSPFFLMQSKASGQRTGLSGL